MSILLSDREAVEAALEPYRQRLYRHVRRLVHDAADAEDLTQETLVRACERMGDLHETAALEGWLYRIATNVCYDFLRAAARRRETGGGLGTDEAGGLEGRQPAADAPGPERVLEQAEMSACGEELLEKIPEAYRRVLLLHDLLGLTSAEIARLLGCTQGTVKIRLHRARVRFRAALEAGCDLYRDERGVLLGIRKPPER